MNDAPKIRVLIAEDHHIVRKALAATLALEPDIEIVAEAADGADAVEKARAWRPDVVLMDIQMPRVTGIAATRLIKQEWPSTHIVMLTMMETDDMIFDALAAGAGGYLLKDAAEADILAAIRAASRGESTLSARIAGKVISEFRRLRPAPAAAQNSLDEPLTDRESAILALVSDGLSNKDIARKLDLAEGTVKNYVSRILDKLHARSRTELAVKARQNQRGG